VVCSGGQICPCCHHLGQWVAAALLLMPTRTPGQLQLRGAERGHPADCSRKAQQPQRWVSDGIANVHGYMRQTAASNNTRANKQS
jgi:hypothetical protein